MTAKTVTRYAITHLNGFGDRTIIGPNQRRHFFDTQDDAEVGLANLLQNNSQTTLDNLYGFPLEIRPVECIIMADGREGDAVSVWFDK
jgi:hypothetical protein